MEKLLLIPGIVAVISGVAAYFFQLLQKWRAISAMLESEINQLLANVRENLDFLDRPSHYWLEPGRCLKSAPKAFSVGYRVLDATLKDLYILGRGKASSVLAFYEYHGFCESLRQSLFDHIRALQEAREPLTTTDVAILRTRLQRLCSAYRTLDSGYPERIELRLLKPTYEIPSAQPVLQALALRAESTPQ